MSISASKIWSFQSSWQASAKDVQAWKEQIYINIQMNIHIVNSSFSSPEFLRFFWEVI